MREMRTPSSLGALRGAPRASRSRRERGVVLPGAVALLGASGVFAAGAMLVLTEPVENAPEARRPAPPAATQTEDVVEDLVATESTGLRVIAGERLKKKKPPKIVRSEVYVEIYNNSSVVGLAGTTASRAQGVGWNVVSVDNWYGSIAAPTVYYGPEMRRQANLLATDLGVDRVVPAVEPMGFDRLTVILTAGYS